MHSPGPPTRYSTPRSPHSHRGLWSLNRSEWLHQTLSRSSCRLWRRASGDEDAPPVCESKPVKRRRAGPVLACQATPSPTGLCGTRMRMWQPAHKTCMRCAAVRRYRIPSPRLLRVPRLKIIACIGLKQQDRFVIYESTGCTVLCSLATQTVIRVQVLNRVAQVVDIARESVLRRPSPTGLCAPRIQRLLNAR